MGIKRDKSGRSSTIFLGKYLYQVRNVLFFSCSVDWKLRWLSFLSILSVFVDFPFWMRLGVRYHCYYLYSVVCQQIGRCHSSNPKTLPSIKTIGTCKFSNPKTWPNVKLENNYHIPDLVQAFPKKIVGQTSHLYDSNNYSSDFMTFFVCILHKFAYSQIKQDGLEVQILGTSWQSKPGLDWVAGNVCKEYCSGQTCKMGYN
jgi:hypothetical protein